MRDPKGMLFVRLIEAVNGEALAYMRVAPPKFDSLKICRTTPKQ